MNFSTINNIKCYFKEKRNKSFKHSLSLLGLSSILGITSVLGITCAIAIHYNNNILIELPIALLFTTSVLIGCSSLSVFFYSVNKLFFIVKNNLSTNEIGLNIEKEPNPFVQSSTYKHNHEFINLITALSLKVNNPNFLTLSEIKKIQEALIYNESILEQTTINDSPPTIQEKIFANIKLIHEVLNIAIYKMYTTKLYNDDEFKNLLEKISLEEKLIQKQEIEKLYLEQQKEQKQKVKKKEESDLLKVQKLENKFNQKMNKVNNYQEKPNFHLQHEENKKYLSL